MQRLPIQDLKGLVRADFLKVFPIAGDQGGSDISRGKGDQGVEGQGPHFVRAVPLFSPDDGKDFGGFEPVTVSRCDDSDQIGRASCRERV